MASYTKNYNLIMPAQEDYYDVQQFNSNANAIDTQMAQTEAEVSGLGTKIDSLIAKVDSADTKITNVGTKIDNLIKKLDTLNTKIGAVSDTGKTTLCGLINNTKVFKSWNRYVYYNKGGVPDASLTIKKVDPSRCVVLVEMITNANAKGYDYEYTLSAESIAISHGTYTNDGYFGLIFTVVELY